MLVIITKRYDSSVLKQKVNPTPIDSNGNPIYAIYLDEERAQVLIDAGVAMEYVADVIEQSNDADNGMNTNGAVPLTTVDKDKANDVNSKPQIINNAKSNSKKNEKR